MNIRPAITRWIAGLLLAGMFLAGLALLDAPTEPIEPPQLSSLLPPLLDRIGSLAVACLQWLAEVLNNG
jgi:hypothetical protein